MPRKRCSRSGATVSGFIAGAAASAAALLAVHACLGCPPGHGARGQTGLRLVIVVSGWLGCTALRAGGGRCRRSALDADQLHVEDQRALGRSARRGPGLTAAVTQVGWDPHAGL